MQDSLQLTMWMSMGISISIGIGIVMSLSVSNSIKDPIVGDLLQQAPQHQEVQQGVNGPLLSQKIIKHPHALHLLRIVTDRLNQIDQILLNLQLLLQRTQNLAIDPLAETRRS